jgi:predicted  nucleic acid-binding Zn-ribbon protein
MLSIFEQKYFAEPKKTTMNYQHAVGDDYTKKMLNILHYVGTDPEERKKLDNEAYWLRYERHTSGEVLRLQNRLAETRGELAEKDREISEKDREISDTRRELSEKEREISETNRRHAENVRNMARRLKADGMTSEFIAQLSGLSEKEVDEL